MERHLISRNIRDGRYLMIVIAAFCSYVLAISRDTETTIAAGVFMVACCVLFYLLHRAREVAHDENYLYISGRGVEQIVPLENVFKIKLTMTRINDSYFWKIGYNDSNGKASAVRVLPQQKSFEHFKNLVSIKNPQVAIKNYSHSFDFDQ